MTRRWDPVRVHAIACCVLKSGQGQRDVTKCDSPSWVMIQGCGEYGTTEKKIIDLETALI